MNRKAFTLVELLVAMSILTVLLGAMFYVFSGQIKFWRRTAAQAERYQVINSVLTRLALDVRAANEILPGSDQALLRLKAGTDIIEYSLSTAKVKRKLNSYSAYLTVEDEIAFLSFAYPDKNRAIIVTELISTEVGVRNQ